MIGENLLKHIGFGGYHSHTREIIKGFVRNLESEV